MRTKRILLMVSVVGLFLAAGCGTSMNRQRQEARDRWATSRAEMVTRLAQGCFDRGEYGRARQHVDEVIRNGVPYAPLYTLAARLSAEKGELDNARTFAENARAIDPKAPEPHYVLGTIEQMLGHPETAQAEFAEAAELDPKQPRYVLAQAEMLVAIGRAEEAAVALDEAVVQMPGQAEVHAALGDVLSLLKRDAEASGCYRIALRLEPQRTDIKERLAASLYQSNAYAEAEPVLAELSEAGPEFANAWARLMQAECLLAIGRPAEARGLFLCELEAKRGGLAPLLGLAKCDILEKRLPEARQRLEAALAQEPRNSEANALEGYVLVATGRHGEAAAHLAMALQDPACEGRPTVERLLSLAQSGCTQP